MSEKLYATLEVCIEALEAGADPESVVKRFPEMKADLLPLLQTSLQARRLAIPEVPEEVRRRGKARLLRRAAGMREAASKAQARKARFSFPRLAVSLAIAFLFLLSGTGLVNASGGALPGDDLYPVKRTWEDVRLLLVINPESRAELEYEFEQERLYEIDKLLAEGRHETIRFAGVVTGQNGNQWVVSGVPVQITADSRLSATTVDVGASVMVQGRTNALGFVEADFIEVLGSNVILPTSVPTQIEMQSDNSNRGSSASEENDNGHEDEGEPASASDEHNGSTHDDETDGSHSGSNKNDNDNGGEDDQKDRNSGSGSDDNNRDGDHSGSDGNQNDNSGPGGGHEIND